MFKKKYKNNQIYKNYNSHILFKYNNFSKISFNEIDYKNIKILKKFIQENGKIISSRLTKNNFKFQKKISLSIKRARYLALLSYTNK